MKKETYKNAMQKIKLSKEKKEEIYENIINRERKNNIFKPILLVTTICLIVIVGTLGTVYAEEIKDTISSFFIKMVYNEETHTGKLEGNVISEINYDADIPESTQYDPQTIYTYEKLETELGKSFLKSDYFKNKNFYQVFTEKEEGKIARSLFTIENFMDTKEKGDGNHTFSIYLKTKYSQNEDISLFAADKKTKEEQYYISSLDTTAYIFKWHDGYRDQQWFVFLEYQNVVYRFEFLFIRNDPNEMWEETINILDSLYL